MVRIASERSEHHAAIEDLLDASFGEARWHKTCQRLRDGRAPIATLGLVALAKDRLVGTVRMWPVSLGRKSGLLLGPLAVDPACRDQGVGHRLMEDAIALARTHGEQRIVLVGDAAYYRRFGFEAHTTTGLTLPGPVERPRFLAKALIPGATDRLVGDVVAAAA